MMILVYHRLMKLNYFVIILCFILFRRAKCAAETVTDQILFFSCDNDALKLTPLNGAGKMTGATICSLFLLKELFRNPHWEVARNISDLWGTIYRLYCRHNTH
jgi:hypothetical protein